MITGTGLHRRLTGYEDVRCFTDNKGILSGGVGAVSADGSKVRLTSSNDQTAISDALTINFSLTSVRDTMTNLLRFTSFADYTRLQCLEKHEKGNPLSFSSDPTPT